MGNIEEDKLDFFDTMFIKINSLEEDFYNLEEEYQNDNVTKEDFLSEVNQYKDLVEEYFSSIDDFSETYNDLPMVEDLVEPLSKIERQLNNIS
jgi:hypothetical protein